MKIRKVLKKVALASACVSFTSCIVPVVAAPIVTFAQETAQTDENTQNFKINTVTKYTLSNEFPLTSEEENKTNYGYLSCDKTEAKSGEQVTIKMVQGEKITHGFSGRYKITRESDGADVTELILGERVQHNSDGETFTMPDYEITITAVIRDYFIGTPPAPYISPDGENEAEGYYPVIIEQTEGGKVSATEGVKDFGSVTGARLDDEKSGERTLIKLKAEPDPGYRFVKWHIINMEYGLAATDDLLKESSEEITSETGDRYVTGTLQMAYGGVRISAVFEETDAHKIISDNEDDKIIIEKSKEAAKVGEKVHIKVNAENSQQPDLTGIDFVRNDTGEVFKEIRGFIGHTHEWEGDIVMPDSDISVKVYSYKWAPSVVSAISISSKQSEGGSVAIEGDYIILEKEGAYVTLTGKPDEGYEFKRWIIKDFEDKEVTDKFEISKDGKLSVKEGAKIDIGEYFVLAEFAKADAVNEQGAGNNNANVNKGSLVSANPTSSVKGSTPQAVTNAISKSTTNAPSTGDNNYNNAWIITGASAAAVAGVAFAYRRKVKKL